MSDRSLSIEDVKKIAILAKLDISGDEERFSKLLSETIDYIKVLQELDTSKVKETFQVTGLTNVFQQKEGQNATISKEEALSNAKEVIDGLIATKGVFDRV